MTPIVLLPWNLSWLQSLSVKKKNPHFQPFKVGQRVLLGSAHILLNLITTLAGADGPRPWLREKLEISVLFKTNLVPRAR